MQEGVARPHGEEVPAGAMSKSMKKMNTMRMSMTISMMKTKKMIMTYREATKKMIMMSMMRIMKKMKTKKMKMKGDADTARVLAEEAEVPRDKVAVEAQETPVEDLLRWTLRKDVK